MNKKPLPHYSTGPELEALGFKVMESSDHHCVLSGPSEFYTPNSSRMLFEAPPQIALEKEEDIYTFFTYIQREYGGGSVIELAYYEKDRFSKKPKLTLIRGGK